MLLLGRNLKMLPMFSDELTNDYPEVTRFLTNAINKNKLANSYVFIGRDLTDISLIVSYLAKILNCEQNKKNYLKPCENCTNCRWLNNNEHPQALMVLKANPNSKKEQIKIDTIRELLNTLKITSDYFRVIFFENSSINYLPPDCCNLLLKSVEETPERTIFIFANSTKHDILPTILSRSQIVYLNKKLNSTAELIKNKSSEIPENVVLDPDLINVQTYVEKLKNTKEYLDENNVDLKDYLLNLAIKNYDKRKYLDPTGFCFFFKEITEAHLKYKSFMQPKIILEDLFISRL